MTPFLSILSNSSFNISRSFGAKRYGLQWIGAASPVSMWCLNLSQHPRSKPCLAKMLSYSRRTESNSSFSWEVREDSVILYFSQSAFCSTVRVQGGTSRSGSVSKILGAGLTGYNFLTLSGRLSSPSEPDESLPSKAKKLTVARGVLSSAVAAGSLPNPVLSDITERLSQSNKGRVRPPNRYA